MSAGMSNVATTSITMSAKKIRRTSIRAIVGAPVSALQKIP